MNSKMFFLHSCSNDKQVFFNLKNAQKQLALQLRTQLLTTVTQLQTTTSVSTSPEAGLPAAQHLLQVITVF
jgi:hypothetical protein